jgi:hypothetical protein
LEIAMDSVLAAVERSPLFSATAAPYVLLDRNLTIHSANQAYLRATGRILPDLVGEYLFDVFPDNPANPDADGVEKVGASLESVLRTSQPSHMWLQRYDIPGPAPGDDFILKYWSPINSPIKDDRGRAAGILHHVEDVTPAFASVAGHGGTGPKAGSLDGASPAATRADAVAFARNREAHARLATRVDQLQQALTSRIAIEQAKGILMAKQRCGPKEAFEILRQAARRSNTKLQDLAAELVARQSGELIPDGETRRWIMPGVSGNPSG